jgi:hypothetical protein
MKRSHPLEHFMPVRANEPDQLRAARGRVYAPPKLKILDLDESRGHHTQSLSVAAYQTELWFLCCQLALAISRDDDVLVHDGSD